MESGLLKVRPQDLQGPRTFFTDLDPADTQQDRTAAIRSLKLQLLLKSKVIIGASSLFHTQWMELFRQQKGLTNLLSDGSLIPALRDQYQTIDDFFIDKKNYHQNAQFFLMNTPKKFYLGISKKTVSGFIPKR